MAGIVVIFDFDKTIINCDSDNWVIDSLGVTDAFDSLCPIMPWNSLMDRMMIEIHSRGKTVEDIADCLRGAPIDPNVVNTVKAAYALGCDLRVVSDANTFFIKTILEHQGILSCFSEINTNPSYIDNEGRLRILPYHDSTTPHNCTLCPPNMCKGMIIERIRSTASANGKKRFIYLGDGKGDYCPSLKLSQVDYMMPRKDYPVWELISNNRDLLNAEVHGWQNFEEQGRLLLQLIRKVIAEEHNELVVSMECKFGTIPLSSREAFQPLPEGLASIGQSV